jgi:acetyl esterase/lipase
VIKNRYEAGGDEYWIYEPDSPKPPSAPVIVFLHGWSATNPAIYGGWIDHLVKRGNIVIFPRYQADTRTPLADFTPNALHAIQNALHRLSTEPGHVHPDLSRFAVVGHSVGGLLAANVGALASENGLPTVRAVMSVEPGRTWNPLRPANILLADLSRIPAHTLLLAVAGDRDMIVRDIDAKRIFKESSNVSKKDKDLVYLVSDNHGQPPLLANHISPTSLDPTYTDGEQAFAHFLPQNPSSGETRRRLWNRQTQGGETTGQMPHPLADALDYFGVWKLFDGLTDAAFYGKNREYALGNTRQQRYMGTWSDGAPVKELIVTNTP